MIITKKEFKDTVKNIIVDGINNTRQENVTEEKNAEAIRAMKISKIKQDTLLSLCDEMAFDINKILASYHHKDISEITEGEYQYIVANKDKANVRKIWI